MRPDCLRQYGVGDEVINDDLSQEVVLVDKQDAGNDNE